MDVWNYALDMSISASPEIPGLTVELFGRAVSVFLRHAYPDGVPERVTRLLNLALGGRTPMEIADSSATLGVNFASRAFELSTDLDLGNARVRYDIRLGWYRFPHLKLSIQPDPSRSGPLFSVNTHDTILLRSTDDPEYPAIAELIRANVAFRSLIERAWEAEGVPTFKSYFRKRLALLKGRATISALPNLTSDT